MPETWAWVINSIPQSRWDVITCPSLALPLLPASGTKALFQCGMHFFYLVLRLSSIAQKANSGAFQLRGVTSKYHFVVEVQCIKIGKIWPEIIK